MTDSIDERTANVGKEAPTTHRKNSIMGRRGWRLGAGASTNSRMWDLSRGGISSSRKVAVRSHRSRTRSERRRRNNKADEGLEKLDERGEQSLFLKPSRRKMGLNRHDIKINRPKKPSAGSIDPNPRSRRPSTHNTLTPNPINHTGVRQSERRPPVGVSIDRPTRRHTRPAAHHRHHHQIVIPPVSPSWRPPYAPTTPPWPRRETSRANRSSTNSGGRPTRHTAALLPRGAGARGAWGTRRC